MQRRPAGLLRQITLVVRKEVYLFALSPVLWCVLAGNLLFLGIVFSLMVYWQDEGYFKDFFMQQGMLLLFLSPAFSMGSFAQERHERTLDMLRVTGLSDTALYVGKLLAGWSLTVLPVLSGLIFPTLLSLYLPVDWPPVLVGLLGCVLMAGVCTAVGLYLSSLTEHPLLAYFGTVGLLLVGVFGTFLGALLEPPADQIVQYLSLFDHLEDFALGLLDVRRVVFFLSFMALFGLLGLSAVYRLREEPGGRLRRLMGGGNQALLAVAAVALTVLLNVGVSRVIWRWDLTQGNRLSLSERSRQVLAELGKEGLSGEITLFRPKETSTGEAMRIELLAREYQAAAPGLKVQVTTLDREPDLAALYQVRRDGTGLVRLGERHVLAGEITESSLTGALARLLLKRPVTIAFAQGHGEPSPLAEKPAGRETITTIAAQLRLEGYDVETFVPYDITEYPAHWDVVVFVGPKSDLAISGEKQHLLAFLHRGGGAVLLLDPPPAPGLGDVLSPFGFQIGEDFIVESGVNLRDNALVPVIFRYYPHEITSSVDRIALFHARTVGVAEVELPGIIKQRLAESSEYSFAELDPKQVAFTEDVDEVGPLPVAAVVERKLEPNGASRVVVVGDSDFVRDDAVSLLGNRTFFTNAVHWCAGGRTGVTVPPRAWVVRIVLPERDTKRLALLSLSLSLLPLGMLIPLHLWKRKR